MRAFVTDGFPLPLPPGHRFPIAKYALLRERATADGILAPPGLRVPDPAPDDVLAFAHAPEYVRCVATGTMTAAEQRRVGLPWSAALAERARRSVGATIAACAAALDDGVAVTLAGGTHHAYADRGEGYCVFNDTAVAVRWLRRQRLCRRILVIDADVHQGNGTAAILAGDDAAYILDLFAERNYPFRKEPASLALAFPDGTGDGDYLAALGSALPRALAAARPDLAIYLAGADPFAGDRLGRLHLTKPGLAARDRMVMDTLRRAGVPIAVTMAGGYAADIADTVDIHLETLRIAAQP